MRNWTYIIPDLENTLNVLHIYNAIIHKHLKTFVCFSFGNSMSQQEQHGLDGDIPAINGGGRRRVPIRAVLHVRTGTHVESPSYRNSAIRL